MPHQGQKREEVRSDRRRPNCGTIPGRGAAAGVRRAISYETHATGASTEALISSRKRARMRAAARAGERAPRKIWRRKWVNIKRPSEHRPRNRRWHG